MVEEGFWWYMGGEQDDTRGNVRHALDVLTNGTMYL